MLRLIVFVIGLGALVVGVSSYFNGVPIPVDLRSSYVTIGIAEFRLDFVMMMLGIPVMLFSLQSVKVK
ncbi:MAG: hypothetical protein P8181_14885 [bacterium]